MGAGITATSAYAAGETLAFGPTNVSATITNLDPGASSANAAATYGLKVTGATATDPAPLRMQVLTGPSSTASVLFERRAANNTPTSARATATASTTLTADALAAGAPTSITVASTTGMTTGDWVAIAGAAGANIEFRQVTVASATSLTFIAALTQNHVSGSAVYDLGAVVGNTTLGADPAASATTLTLASSAGMTVGDWVSIAGDTAAHAELRRIVTIPNGTSITVAAISGTDGDHGNGAAVVDLGAGSALTAQAAAAATTLTMESTAGFAAGDQILVGGTTPEVVMVSSVDNGTTVTLKDALVYTHATASPVVNRRTAVQYAPVPVAGSRQVANYDLGTNTDNIYLGATDPGSYTLRFFKDRNGNGAYDSTQDDATPTFSLDVKDVNTTTSTTADDLAPVVSVTSAAGVGENVIANVSMGGLTTVDTRGLNGGSPSVGSLGVAVAAASSLTFDNVALPLAGGGSASTSFDGTNITRTSGPAVAGTGTTTFTIGSGITRTGSTLVANNTVATVDEDVTNVVGTVKDATGTGARAVHVKAGTGTVTYTALVKNATPAVVAGATVRFTLTSGTNSPTLTANGTLVSSSSTTKVYSAVSDSTGYATLQVTSDITTAGTTYTVSMSTNGVTADLLSTAYEAVAATTLENTNTDASLLVTPGSSATLTGRLLDQFDAAYAPSGSDSAQVAVRVPAGGTTVGNAVISSGAFSYVYTPSTTPTAGTQTTFDFYYSTTTLNGTDSAINWASNEAAASVTMTSPVAGATPVQKTATATHGAGTTITGSVLNASNGGLAYKTVTLTGSAGVYFSNAATPTTVTTDNLATSVAVASNGSGVYTGYAFFTKAGAATITATSGSAAQTVNVVVTQTSDPWAVTASNATVEPGGTSVVTGSVNNGFGHPVSGATVNLSLGATTAATLGATTVTTNSDGVWSTTLTGASGGSGTATLTASLNGQTANATAHADWLANTGLTIANGTYTTTATVTIDPTINQTTLTGPTSRVGAGYVALSGTAKASTAVEIYGKASASSAAYGLVGLVISGTDGAWSSSQYVSTTSLFFAKTTASTSSTITVTVTAPPAAPRPVLRSTVSVRGTALGSGRVRLVGDGGPTGRGVMKFYRWNGRSYALLISTRANVRGDATVVGRAPRGNQTFRAVYTAPGRQAAGANVRIRVR